MRILICLMMILADIFPITAKTQTHSDGLKGNSSVFKREVPKLRNGKYPSYYLNKRIVEHMMGLQSLENGFDSLQIRFWYGYARTDSSQLIVFSRKDNLWTVQLFTFVYVFDASKKAIKSIKMNEKTASPKSGWERFSQMLSKLSIPSLPDESEIRNYPEYADGNALIVEVATKNSYRIYSYKEPIQAQAHIEDAKKVEQALRLIENQFDFKQLRKF